MHINFFTHCRLQNSKLSKDRFLSVFIVNNPDADAHSAALSTKVASQLKLNLLPLQ